MRKECHSRWISIRRRVDKGENGIGNRRPGQEEDAKVVEDCQPACIYCPAHQIPLSPSGSSLLYPFTYNPHLPLRTPLPVHPSLPAAVCMSDTSVTISLLPVSLSLVHLPRTRLDHFTSLVLRQILLPNPTFLNVTSNEIEVSLFAEHDTLQEFHKAARKDARRLRQRERYARADAPDSPHRFRRVKEDWEPIEVTSERWKVLQIDTHSDGLGTFIMCSM